jgi:dihydrofolate reductase
MRKIFTFLVSTVDGYYEGANGEFDWPVVDDEFNDFAVEQLDETDTLLFGRVTYEGMAAYWPTPAAERYDPAVAGRMNSLPKVVVSRTLDRVDWHNTTLIKANVVEELTALKERPGRDIVCMGSSALTVNLLKWGLLDELRVMVMPIALGAGRSVLRTADERIGLTLVSARPFKSGNVLLTYQPAAAQREFSIVRSA